MYKYSAVIVILGTTLSVIFNCLASFGMIYLTNAMSQLQTQLIPPVGTDLPPNVTSVPAFSTISIIVAVLLVFYFLNAFGL
ncbi:hypothetical protein IKD48_03015 [bacterium]|nr:hypothetical protein [bacterium]